MLKVINVIKRSGEKELLDLSKLHRVVSWACEGLKDVSASEVEIKSQIQFYDKIKSTDIQETMIKSAADLISEDSPDYQYVAGRLINYHLRKEVYGDITPWHLSSIIERGIEKGLYTKEFHQLYNRDEINELNDYIIHDRDFNYTYCAMEQWRGKYLIRNRQTNKYIETPQVALMLISMLAFSNEENNRLEYVKRYYDALSEFYITIPTPILGGLRTTQKQFSSCVLIDVDDTLDSINAAASATVKYVSQRAGIGLNVGKIRAIGSKVKGGLVTHTGLIPFIKYFQSAIKSCSQGGIRGGAGTLHFPIWHYEIEDLLVLKNNKGTEDVRARHLDYSIQFNKLMYQRLIEDGYITLFSPNEVPGLYDAFFNNQEKFQSLYESAEKNQKIRKKRIKASELFASFMQERKDTGRLYLMNVDHCNSHSSFDEKVAPVHSSNLCVAGTTKVDAIVDGVLFPDIQIKDVISALAQGKPILVKSYDINTDKIVFKRVTAGGLTKKSAKVIKVNCAGKELILTPEHRVYTKNRGYVEAQDLRETDLLVLI